MDNDELTETMQAIRELIERGSKNPVEAAKRLLVELQARQNTDKLE